MSASLNSENVSSRSLRPGKSMEVTAASLPSKLASARSQYTKLSDRRRHLIELTAPSTDAAVSLRDARAHQCRAIIEYQGELGRPLFCGHPTVTKIVDGRAVPTSWCSHHRKIYVREPGEVATERRFKKASPPKAIKKASRQFDPATMMSIPEAGHRLFNIGASASFAAVKAGTIPVVRIQNRRPVVMIATVEKMLADREKAKATVSGAVDADRTEVTAAELLS
jgi:hypothetical protein